MTTVIQYVIIGITVTVAVLYAVMRVYAAVKAASDPCHGCVGCALREQKKKAAKAGESGKMECFNKKQTKNLA